MAANRVYRKGAVCQFGLETENSNIYNINKVKIQIFLHQ